MQITLKDVAEQSGFSVTTVSRALSGYDDVNPRTREHILKIADQLGYQPNLVARQLRSQNTYTIGLIIPNELNDAEDDFFGLLLKGISHTTANNGYDVLVGTHLPDADPLEPYHRIVGGRRVDGVIVARTYREDPRIRYLRERRHPFVVAGRAGLDEISDFPYIDADSQKGLRMLVQHFVGYGHRQIGLILSPDALAFTPYRLTGYQEGLAGAGIPYQPEYVIAGDMTRQGGSEAAHQLLSRAPQLTAIIACNDLMAIGAMSHLQERGLTPGVDVAIGGFDDIPLAAHIYPALTTIHQPIYQIGQQLARMLLQIIAGQTPSEEAILLKPTLVIRESSGGLR